MEYQTPESRCHICNGEFSNKGLARHIKSCLSKKLNQEQQGKPEEMTYVHVKPTHNPDYFLHLLVRETATLKDLDHFLRGIWLECCGHLSAFSFQPYGGEIAMSKKVKDVLDIKNKIEYQYDFGDTTELTMKRMGSFEGGLEKKAKIQVLSRNTQPVVPCDVCGEKEAVEICTQCQWDDRGWLCEDCVVDHECEEEMRLPVVNSPRTGVCGYCG